MSGINIEGFEDLESMMQELTTSDTKERAALRKAIMPIAKQLEKDSPKRSSSFKMKLSKIKIKVRKVDLANVATASAGAWWDRFNEFGTSKSKKNVGYFEKGVNRSKDEALKVLSEEILKAVR